MNPLVTVVTPSFNTARFIRETIESVHSQDYPAIEHIIIDGGSTDGTLQILKEYPHLTWVSEPDRGQSDAVNKGFRRAKGEIIGWLNSDDTYTPGAVSYSVDFLQEHPEVDAVHSDCNVVDENSQLLWVVKSQPFRLDTFLMKSYIKQPTVFMCRRVVETLGGVDENLDYVIDREFWLRVGMAFKMEYLPERILANFRLCPGTKSYEEAPKFHTFWLQVLERIFRDPAFDLPEALKKAARQKSMGGYFLTSATSALKNNNRLAAFNYLLQAVYHDRNLVRNRGFWFYVSNVCFGTQLAGEKIKKLSSQQDHRLGLSDRDFGKKDLNDVRKS